MKVISTIKSYWPPLALLAFTGLFCLSHPKQKQNRDEDKKSEYRIYLGNKLFGKEGFADKNNDGIISLDEVRGLLSKIDAQDKIIPWNESFYQSYNGGRWYYTSLPDNRLVYRSIIYNTLPTEDLKKLIKICESESKR